METNIYKPPESNLTPVEPQAPEFYVVARNKFLILFISTVGLYRLYWFYKHWSLYKARSGKKMWPVMRGIFSIFFTHALFGLFEAKSKEVDPRYTWFPSGMATLYVIMAILENISDKLSRKSLGDPYTDFIILFTLPVIGWTLYKAQLSANIACSDPEGAINSELTLANSVWIALGVIFWLLVAVGLYGSAVGLPI